ncbi:hypothetical protein HanHA300_Chr16g0634681 [Helianthus annuus]|nr:hypothetical protein HanHA300_Chr16g0634681 [Helianthus annuus]KAJ0462667.1 hypothetical protein HanHA89_Chr16g0685841 [Helianthus annuus]KAJ0643055.1 hypothetical protein HanLR1_Chr16g0645151 [Helianthus annuus]KAJ0646921.1 hypothetical protein HanOQP8_Chr16g0640481 [Helianthus annuus]
MAIVSLSRFLSVTEEIRWSGVQVFGVIVVSPPTLPFAIGLLWVN